MILLNKRLPMKIMCNEKKRKEKAGENLKLLFQQI